MNGLGLPCFPNLDNNKVLGGLQALDLQILSRFGSSGASGRLELQNGSQGIDLIMKSNASEALRALSSEMLPRASI